MKLQSAHAQKLRAYFKYFVLTIFIICLHNSVIATTWFVNDASITGDVFTSAAGNNANSGTASSPFATIAFAISTASSGDTINVDAGNYASGDIFITKRLVIRGAKTGVQAWPDPSSVRGTNETNITGSFYFNANIDSICVDGFSINMGISARGIEARGLRTIIINNIVTGTVNIFVQQQGIATRSNAGVRIHSYLIRNNKVTNIRTGIYMDGGRDLPSEISFNYVSGSFTAGYTLTASNGHLVSANVSDNNSTGMLITKGGNIIEKNTIINNTNAGIRIAATDSTFNNLIQNNFIQNNGVGIALTEDNAAAINNKAYFNSITGNTVSIGNAHSANFEATCNWFGTTVSGDIAADITGNVTFVPFLTDGNDADLVQDGFQPSTTCTIVPVNLLSFDAFPKNKNVLLQWKTNAEINSSHFIIQRSYDQVQFDNIGSVRSNNNIYLNSYSFIDDNVTEFGKPIFYRLQMVDLDGTSKKSYIRTTQINIPGLYVQQIFPNPLSAGSDLKLKIYSDKNTSADVTLINATGQIMLRKNINLQKGNQIVNLKMPLHVKGACILTISTVNQKQHMTLLIQ